MTIHPAAAIATVARVAVRRSPSLTGYQNVPIRARSEDDFLRAADPCAGRPRDPRVGACDPTRPWPAPPFRWRVWNAGRVRPFIQAAGPAHPPQPPQRDRSALAALSPASLGLASPLSTPIRRMRSACCACAASGHVAALPSPTMNSRRRISDLPRLDRQPIAVGAACLSLIQSFLRRGRPVLAHCCPQPTRWHVRSWRKETCER
jgi:hypothetical protein